MAAIGKQTLAWPLDAGAHPIVNVGTPPDPTAATIPDLATIPLPNAAAGAPGDSLLASPSDHQHPIDSTNYGAAIGVSTAAPSEISCPGTAEGDTVWGAVDLTAGGVDVFASFAVGVQDANTVTQTAALTAGHKILILFCHTPI